MSKTNIFKRL